MTKIKREYRMMSLDNAYSAADMGEFHRRVVEGLRDGDVPTFAIEPKPRRSEHRGRLRRRPHGASHHARGDGVTGEDITPNVRTISGVPSRIKHEKKLTLRGEVAIYRKDLDALNADRIAAGLEPFANPRNARPALYVCSTR